MQFELIKDLSLITEYYGEMPETFNASDDAYEVYKWTLDDQMLLAEDFVTPINELCGVCLDVYDVDYFDSTKCVLLKSWLENRLNAPCATRLQELYGVLLDYASRAIDLKTGVVVEL